MAIYPIGDCRLLELTQQDAERLRGRRPHVNSYDDGVGYEPDRGDRVAGEAQFIQPAGSTTSSSGALIGTTPWETTAAAPQWVETTTSDSTTPYPTHERPPTYRLLADGTLELVEENGSAINPVSQPVQPYQPYPVLPYSPLNDGVVDSHQQLAGKVEELTRTVELLQTSLQRLERQQPDVEDKGIDQQPNRKLVI